MCESCGVVGGCSCESSVHLNKAKAEIDLPKFPESLKAGDEVEFTVKGIVTYAASGTMWDSKYEKDLYEGRVKLEVKSVTMKEKNVFTELSEDD